MSKQYSKSALGKLNKPKLVEIGTEEFGIDVAEMTNPDAIDAILAAQAKQGGTPPADPPAEPVTQTSPANHDQPDDKVDKTKLMRAGAGLKGEKRYRIIIGGSNEEGGDRDVVVNVQGRAIQIKREHEVSIPERYLHALQNAKMTVFRDGPVIDGRPTKVESKASRFPLQVLGEDKG